LFPSHFRSPFSSKSRNARRSNRSKRRAVDSKTNGETRRISENAAFLKISRNFRKIFRARKKTPLDGRRVERRFRGFLSFERDFLETLKPFNGGA